MMEKEKEKERERCWSCGKMMIDSYGALHRYRIIRLQEYGNVKVCSLKGYSQALIDLRLNQTIEQVWGVSKRAKVASS